MRWTSARPKYMKPNFLPLLDIILILLIFFMYALVTLSQTGRFDVSLPRIKSAPSEGVAEKQVLFYRKDGHLILENKEYENIDEMMQDIKDIKYLEMFLSADGDIPYRKVLSVISRLRDQGVGRISLLYEIEGV